MRGIDDTVRSVKQNHGPRHNATTMGRNMNTPLLEQWNHIFFFLEQSLKVLVLFSRPLHFFPVPH